MIYKEITATAPRKAVYPERRVVLPRLTLAPFHTEEHEQWIRENWWMVDYSVFMDDKAEAQELANKLNIAFSKDPSHPDIPDLISNLKRLRTNPPGELTPLEYWTKSAYQLADYCGGTDPHVAISERLAKYSGNVLEAMCGHMSYFAESAKRTVTALDYCPISLERYPFPNRRRIQCDLNQITSDTHISFIPEGSLDVVSICFGYKYPEDIVALVAEFFRLLKPSGVLSFIENPDHGYKHLYKRDFVQREAREVLVAQKFQSVTTELIEIPGWDGNLRYPFYHLEAVK